MPLGFKNHIKVVYADVIKWLHLNQSLSMPIKVAIVEDDAEIRNGFAALLATTDDLRCVGAYGSAENFMKAFEALSADIVVMDVQLPGISGIECIKKLKAIETATQFLVCSVYEDEDKIFNALCAGAVGYILKNTTPLKFFDAIREVYSGGSPMSGEIARKVVTSFKPLSVSKHNITMLTGREKEILELLAKGYRYKEIADMLFISIKTVRTHIRNIYEKLQVNSRMDAVNKAFGK
jgi:DNA-binding NarL/FixJ family response regulator